MAIFVEVPASTKLVLDRYKSSTGASIVVPWQTCWERPTAQSSQLNITFINGSSEGTLSDLTQSNQVGIVFLCYIIYSRIGKI